MSLKYLKVTKVCVISVLEATHSLGLSEIPLLFFGVLIKESKSFGALLLNERVFIFLENVILHIFMQLVKIAMAKTLAGTKISRNQQINLSFSSVLYVNDLSVNNLTLLIFI